MSNNPAKLTVREDEILSHLEFAWNLFIKIPRIHPDELYEFKDAIHRLQGIIACRVAKRVDPEVWK